jgi:hypothetical protein
MNCFENLSILMTIYYKLAYMFGNGGGGKGENPTTCKAKFQKKFKS